ncbi:hypothetical protein H5410_002027 [Solanum commersonii]|uniref:Uncharacterized protein n=1 Tax=Solanum commersonii TaxID=4109 RepID=A0A9J6B0Q3_SOLCO|nr:hypothetical protein H5410_002027 [Solanum commersonii]
MKEYQKHLLAIKKRAWKHKKALYHMDKAIFEMKQVYFNTTSRYHNSIIFSIHEMKLQRIEDCIAAKSIIGDVPLAHSAQNISKVNTDMPISKSKDEGKSRENEASSSSSAKAEKIISGKPESKTNVVPSGTKVFSSFQVGKQHPKEIKSIHRMQRDVK